MDFPGLPESLVQHIFECRGAIFGGFLRDSFAGVSPNDIDVAIPMLYFDQFLAGMEELGYYEYVGETTIFKKPGELPVEVTFVEDDPDDTRIGPEAEPDFDVNLLALDEDGLWEWTGGEYSVEEIIEHIKHREAVAIEPSPERTAKILSKGYRIR